MEIKLSQSHCSFYLKRIENFSKRCMRVTPFLPSNYKNPQDTSTILQRLTRFRRLRRTDRHLFPKSSRSGRDILPSSVLTRITLPVRIFASIRIGSGDDCDCTPAGDFQTRRLCILTPAPRPRNILGSGYLCALIVEFTYVDEYL